MATLRDIKEFIAELEARSPEGRSITQEDIADLGQSLAKVAGVMAVKGGATAIVTAAGWNRLDVFDTSRDTQGVREGLLDTPPGSYYHLFGAGAGDYSCALNLRFSADTDGDYEFRITSANDDTTPDVFESSSSPYHDEVALVAGEEGHIVISALLKNLVGTNRLQVEYRGPNGSELTVSYGQFAVSR